MRTYTKNEIQRIADLAYRRGFEDGRGPKDRCPEPQPPPLEDLGISHPLESSDDPENMRRKRPWLEGMVPFGAVPGSPPGKPT